MSDMNKAFDWDDYMRWLTAEQARRTQGAALMVCCVCRGETEMERGRPRQCIECDRCGSIFKLEPVSNGGTMSRLVATGPRYRMGWKAPRR